MPDQQGAAYIYASWSNSEELRGVLASRISYLSFKEYY